MCGGAVHGSPRVGLGAIRPLTPHLVLVEVVRAHRMAGLAGRQHDLRVVPAPDVEHLAPRWEFPRAESLEPAVADAHHGRAITRHRHRPAVEEPAEHPPALRERVGEARAVHLLPAAGATRPPGNVGGGIGRREQEDVVARLAPIHRADVIPPARAGFVEDRVQPGDTLGARPLVVAAEDIGGQLVAERAAPEAIFERLEHRRHLPAVHHEVPAAQPLEERDTARIAVRLLRAGERALEALEHIARRAALAVELQRRRRGHVDLVVCGEHIRDAHRAVRAHPVAGDVRRVAAQHRIVRAGEEAARRVQQPRQRAGAANRRAAPGGGRRHRTGAVGASPRRQLAGHEIPDVAVDIRVDGVERDGRELVERGLEVAPVGGAVHRLERIAVAAVEAFPPQHEGALLPGARHVGREPRRRRFPVERFIGVDDPLRSLPHLERHGRGAALDWNGQRFDGHRRPALRALNALARQVEGLHDEVLHVGAGVRDAPGDTRVVADGHEGRARHRHALHVETSRHEVEFVPDRRHLENEVRIVGEDGTSGGGAGAGHDPRIAVATRRGGVEPGKRRRIRCAGPRQQRRLRRGGGGGGSGRRRRGDGGRHDDRWRRGGLGEFAEHGRGRRRIAAGERVGRGLPERAGERMAHQFGALIFGEAEGEQTADGQ